MGKEFLCGLSFNEIFSLISPFGFSGSNAVSITNCLYKKRISEISQFTKIPNKLKETLITKTSVGVLMPMVLSVSNDGTKKYLFKTQEGKEFETVFIPERKRNTVCVSTQSGCRMGCPYCVTSRYGFRGNLSAGEIVNQIISIPDTEKVTHVVLMGMGEPMDNLENVLKACDILTAEWGLSISPRNITVSTVGIIPEIEIFLEKSKCNLTFSLHTPFPEQRKIIVPAEKRYPSIQIMDLLKNYPLKKKRRISLAYVMIRGLNDEDIHLEELKKLLKGSKIRINLLPYHPGENDLNVSSTDERMQFFKHNLVVSGISASIRKSRGIDISAACGLLATGLK
jgi:23S rRNA (adenine2503-C2)-methyltransferase